jgi:hypothetical protein
MRSGDRVSVKSIVLGEGSVFEVPARSLWSKRHLMTGMRAAFLRM